MAVIGNQASQASIGSATRADSVRENSNDEPKETIQLECPWFVGAGFGFVRVCRRRRITERGVERGRGWTRRRCVQRAELRSSRWFGSGWSLFEPASRGPERPRLRRYGYFATTGLVFARTSRSFGPARDQPARRHLYGRG